jgi:hypothetical protein
VSGAPAENQWFNAFGFVSPAVIAPRGGAPIVVDTTGKIWFME